MVDAKQKAEFDCCKSQATFVLLPSFKRTKPALKLSFRIHYHTQWGQYIALVGSLPELGEWNPKYALQLQYLTDGHWGLSLDVPVHISSFEYRYLLISADNQVLDQDWGAVRALDFSENDTLHIVLQDCWRSKHHSENAFYCAAFEQIFKADRFKTKTPALDRERQFLRFQIRCAQIKAGQRLCLLGSIPILRNWQGKQALLLSNEGHPLWSVTLPNPGTKRIEYKYGIFDTSSKQLLQLEAGPNRVLDLSQLPVEAHLIQQTDEYFNQPDGAWKGAGVAIPVFSLRTAKSLGVGEFTDLKKLVDWAHKVGMKMVQILPVNDTIAQKNWIDSYPYAAISVFALHPQYLNLEGIEGSEKVMDKKEYSKLRRKLNGLPEVDYEAVLTIKLTLARQIFEATKAHFLKKTDFVKYLQDNAHWLQPYAWFCVLRDQNGTANFQCWKTDKRFTVGRLKKAVDLKGKLFSDIAFYYFLQYHLDRQLRQAASYARRKGVVLKGDIPIGIYRHSVDAWVAPQLYNMNSQAGAPPDPFSEIGQNWGFPTYNWEAMAKDGYQWWQQRLRQLSHYFDAFRIDHILGFFRIWEIPVEQVQGTMGRFQPALPVEIREFAERGIPFDRERFCQPFLPEWLIDEQFGEEASFVKQHFLEKRREGYFRFRKAFDTQRKVAAFFGENSNKDQLFLQDRLYTLISNVLFFEEPGSKGQLLHPRIDFQKTPSFKALDSVTRHQLDALYQHYFYERQEALWKEEAMRKLPAIKSATNMLICGEDLGMVPACVPGVMKDLGILSLEIQRMSKNPQTEFLQPEDIPYTSVCSPSTHDMAPLRLWWQQSDWAQIQRFYNKELGREGLCPEQCEAWLAEAILRQQLHGPAMWVVFALQDLLAMSEALRRDDPAAERINVPANPQHYWRYRMHLRLEDMLKASSFNDQLKGMLQEAGRDE